MVVLKKGCLGLKNGLVAKTSVVVVKRVGGGHQQTPILAIVSYYKFYL